MVTTTLKCFLGSEARGVCVCVGGGVEKETVACRPSQEMPSCGDTHTHTHTHTHTLTKTVQNSVDGYLQVWYACIPIHLCFHPASEAVVAACVEMSFPHAHPTFCCLFFIGRGSARVYREVSGVGLSVALRPHKP